MSMSEDWEELKKEVFKTPPFRWFDKLTPRQILIIGLAAFAMIMVLMFGGYFLGW